MGAMLDSMDLAIGDQRDRPPRDISEPQAHHGAMAHDEDGPLLGGDLRKTRDIRSTTARSASPPGGVAMRSCHRRQASGYCAAHSSGVSPSKIPNARSRRSLSMWGGGSPSARATISPVSRARERSLVQITRPPCLRARARERALALAPFRSTPRRCAPAFDPRHSRRFLRVGPAKRGDVRVEFGSWSCRVGGGAAFSHGARRRCASHENGLLLADVVHVDENALGAASIAERSVAEANGAEPPFRVVRRPTTVDGGARPVAIEAPVVVLVVKDAHRIRSTRHIDERTRSVVVDSAGALVVNGNIDVPLSQVLLPGEAHPGGDEDGAVNSPALAVELLDAHLQSVAGGRRRIQNGIGATITGIEPSTPTLLENDTATLRFSGGVRSGVAMTEGLGAIAAVGTGATEVAVPLSARAVAIGALRVRSGSGGVGRVACADRLGSALSSGAPASSLALSSAGTMAASPGAPAGARSSCASSGTTAPPSPGGVAADARGEEDEGSTGRVA